MKSYVTGIAVTTGTYIAAALGGWDVALQTLIIFMAVDYVSGIIVAGVFKNSQMCDSGTLSSKCSFQGLARKGMQLLIVLIAYRLDTIIGTDFVRTAVIIAFMSSELISITENAGLMDIPIPDKISKSIDVLNAGGRK